jgi:hypothetical protein
MDESGTVVLSHKSAHAAALTIHLHLTVRVWRLDGTYWFQDDVSPEAVRVTSCHSVGHAEYILILEDRYSIEN